MGTQTFSPPVQALGRETAVHLPAVAVPTAVTLAEVSATGSIHLTCNIRKLDVSADQAKSKKYRLCSKQGSEVLGRADWSIANIMFVDDPQALDSSTLYPHKALTPSLTGWILRRQGLDSDPGNFTAFAAAQRYDIFQVTYGIRIPVPVAPEEDGQEFEYGQVISVQQRYTGALVT